jgi:hypothetical protein
MKRTTTYQGEIMFQKYIVPVLGVGAFIVGGIVAREKAVDMLELVEKVLSDSPSDS